MKLTKTDPYEFFIVATGPYLKKAFEDLMFIEKQEAIYYYESKINVFPNIHVYRCEGTVDREPLK